MIGLDTTVLIDYAFFERPNHLQVREKVSTILDNEEERFVLTPQVFQEFLHVATDPKRFKPALSFPEALKYVDFWCSQGAVELVYVDALAFQMSLKWMNKFRLGRKRILDTQLAAVYYSNEVYRLATANTYDFSLFQRFYFEDWAIT